MTTQKESVNDRIGLTQMLDVSLSMDQYNDMHQKCVEIVEKEQSKWKELVSKLIIIQNNCLQTDEAQSRMAQFLIDLDIFEKQAMQDLKELMLFNLVSHCAHEERGIQCGIVHFIQKVVKIHTERLGTVQIIRFTMTKKLNVQ